NNIASLYIDQGRFADAEAVLRRVLLLTEASTNPENQSLSHDIIGNLGMVLSSEGRLEESARFVEGVFKEDEQALATDNPKVLSEMHNLAGTYADLGRLDEAVELYRRVLAIKEKQYGPDDPALGMTLDGLANTLDRQANYDEAVRLMNR